MPSPAQEEVGVEVQLALQRVAPGQEIVVGPDAVKTDVAGPFLDERARLAVQRDLIGRVGRCDVAPTDEAGG